MDARAEADLAGWLTEAFETGNALAPLPGSHLPADTAAGERVAAAVLERLGLPACGLRLLVAADGTVVAGPMLEGRLLAARRPVALAALRHARASAAVIGVLAAPLAEAEHAPPTFTSLHPAIDLAAGRMREAVTTPGLLAADLAGLGQVVAGRAVMPSTELDLGAVPVTLARVGERARPVTADLGAALLAAAAAARRLGGLPAGAVLIVAGLGVTRSPRPDDRLSVGLGPLGRVRASVV